MCCHCSVCTYTVFIHNCSAAPYPPHIASPSMASTHALAGCQACIFALNCLVEGKSHTLNAKANAICISSGAAIVARGGNSTLLALLSAAAGMHLAWQLINDLSTKHTRGTHTHGDKNLGESHSHPCRSSSAPQLTDDCLSFVSVLFCFFSCQIV